MDIEINSAEDLYEGASQFPYACDLIAYYIFGSESYDNAIVQAFRGAYGYKFEDDEMPSIIALNYEYNFMDALEDIEMEVRNLKMSDGRTLEEIY